jgi:hypothetical protein
LPPALLRRCIPSESDRELYSYHAKGLLQILHKREVMRGLFGVKRGRCVVKRVSKGKAEAM